MNNIFLLVKPYNRSGSKINCITFGENESLNHILLKAEVCYQIKKAGGSFLTEATFRRTGKRADILSNLGSSGTIYEILSSEKLEDCINKVKQYPLYPKIIACWKEEGEIKMETIREGQKEEEMEWKY